MEASLEAPAWAVMLETTEHGKQNSGARWQLGTSCQRLGGGCVTPAPALPSSSSPSCSFMSVTMTMDCPDSPREETEPSWGRVPRLVVVRLGLPPVRHVTSVPEVQSVYC